MTAPQHTPSTSRAIRCVSCAGRVPSDVFSYTSVAKKRVVGVCSRCGRQMSLPTATWLRWSV